MKSYTNIEQSKKLAEVLPLESADMYYPYDYVFDELESIPTITEEDDHFVLFPKDVRCWSLAALLDALPRIKNLKPVLDLEFNYVQYETYDIDLNATGDNPVDACVEMIIKLSELNLL